ncbi:uncharacterized protein B0H18DRAFT_1154919 [Fomitopsis serialis]|uniref:uncharacterized protein n=1 Tax=Fomitopsis serialis TaxID=139415 RepID=UPI002007F9A6|nr:uncharacterized protein B0H18DRAFT_1154919 [Neoantrodia serialis]KAH9912904.1 hypothetical protein B0H18DRAFT_1154919 [Neoantrodia serialis]
MIGIFLPHPSLGSGSVDTCFQQPHPDNEDAHTCSSRARLDRRTRSSKERSATGPMQRPSKWTSLSNAFLQKWPNLHFTAPQIPSVHSKKAMTLLVDYTLQCIFYAAVFAAYAGASTFLGLVPLAFIPEEPYAGDANVIFLGALGGSILSVGFTTVHWGFYRLEELYELLTAYTRSQADDTDGSTRRRRMTPHHRSSPAATDPQSSSTASWQACSRPGCSDL